MCRNRILAASLLTLGLAVPAAPIRAQVNTNALAAGSETEAGRVGTLPTTLSFTSRKDSLDWVRNKKRADESKGFRILVSLAERRLWVVSRDDDTLLTAAAAVASGQTLSYQGFTKTFDMPRGMRTVLGKDDDPVWTPPKWLYVEAAKELGLNTREIPKSGLTMPDGRRLYVNAENEIGVMTSDGPTKFVDKNLHLIFDDVLYVPPIGTENRKVHGTLVKYKLDLGEGFLFHGTPLKSSIGVAATHGCVRLDDADIEWLYENVPVGTKVYIY